MQGIRCKRPKRPRVTKQHNIHSPMSFRQNQTPIMTNSFLNCCIAPRVLSRGSRTESFSISRASAFGACAGWLTREAHQTRRKQPDPGNLQRWRPLPGFPRNRSDVDYLINIGQPTQFVNAAPGSTFQSRWEAPARILPLRLAPTGVPASSGHRGQRRPMGSDGGRQLAARGDPTNTLYSTNPRSNAVAAPLRCRTKHSPRL